MKDSKRQWLKWWTVNVTADDVALLCKVFSEN